MKQYATVNHSNISMLHSCQQNKSKHKFWYLFIPILCKNYHPLWYHPSRYLKFSSHFVCFRLREHWPPASEGQEQWRWWGAREVLCGDQQRAFESEIPAGVFSETLQITVRLPHSHGPDWCISVDITLYIKTFFVNNSNKSTSEKWFTHIFSYNYNE